MTIDSKFKSKMHHRSINFFPISLIFNLFHIKYRFRSLNLLIIMMCTWGSYPFIYVLFYRRKLPLFFSFIIDSVDSGVDSANIYLSLASLSSSGTYAWVRTWICRCLSTWSLWRWRNGGPSFGCAAALPKARWRSTTAGIKPGRRGCTPGLGGHPGREGELGVPPVAFFLLGFFISEIIFLRNYFRNYLHRQAKCICIYHLLILD